MPRSAVLGNGNLLVALDYHNMIEDLTFPYVGMEDHVAYQHHHRLGIHLDGRFSWLSDKEWEHRIHYIPDTVVTASNADNAGFQLKMVFNDFVYPTENVFVRKITLIDESGRDRPVKIFFNQDFHIYGDKQQDTAYYEPEHKAIVHYRKRRYFWASGMNHDMGVDSFTTGKSEYRGLEGTWKDAEDGNLHRNPIEQGSVDSTIEFDMILKANSTTVFYVWICAGETLDAVHNIHDFVIEETPEKLLKNTVNYWKSWVNKEKDITVDLSDDLRHIYKQSLLIVRTQIDNRGAIIAANDSDIMKFNKDTYTYMWPRDGAWVAMSLDHAGYGEISRRFFEFCADVISREGFLLHKYNPDRSVGSSWHPWFKDGKRILPIQEDETAIVLLALDKHFSIYSNLEFIQKMYTPLISKAGDFLHHFVDEATGLPRESYDLWEEKWGVFSYTAACTYAGLMAASHLCEALGHYNHFRRYQRAADALKEAILKHLYDEETGRFLKRITVDKDTGTIDKDYQIDASMHGIWMFGLLPPDDERVIRTNEEIFRALSIPTEIGGLARYEGDTYQRVEEDYGNIPGNPWIITTLWHAQWKLALAKTQEDLAEVEGTIKWAMKHTNRAGILPEQLNPFNGYHLSVAPLTWSHSTLIETLLQFAEKEKDFQI
jgi:oligosaccharide amylase